MANELRDFAWDSRDPTLRGHAKSVLARICDRADKNTHEAFAGVTSLAADCGFSRPTVMAAVSYLIKTGFLIVVHEGSGRRSRTFRVNRDRLKTPSGQACLPQTTPTDLPSGQACLPQDTPEGLYEGPSSGQDFSRSGQLNARSGQNFGRSGQHGVHESLILESLNQELPRASARGLGPPNENLWHAILDFVEAKIKRHEFMTWFVDTLLATDGRSEITVIAPTALHGEWIQKQHGPLLEEALRSLGRAECVIRFVAAEPDKAAAGGRR